MLEHPELLAQLAKSLRELADIIGIIRKNVISGWGFRVGTTCRRPLAVKGCLGTPRQ